MPAGLGEFRGFLRGKRNASRYLWSGLLVLLAMSPFLAFFALLPEDEDPASSESPDAAALTEAVDLAFPFPTESPSPSPEPEPSPVPTRAAPPPPPPPAPAPAPAPAPEPEPEPTEEAPSPAPSPEPSPIVVPDDDDDEPRPVCDPFTGIGCEEEPAEEEIEEEIEEEVPASSTEEGNGQQGPTEEGSSGQ